MKELEEPRRAAPAPRGHRGEGPGLGPEAAPDGGLRHPHDGPLQAAA
ncbi:MAG: hypothetical protein M0C28_42700 [Candidatus Moduliflexus flocculans]|nr:hypothetical protein [Candidatus Moduliflexus flocculans]